MLEYTNWIVTKKSNNKVRVKSEKNYLFFVDCKYY